MSTYTLTAEGRTDTGKEKAKKLRAAGRFPAIVYGAGGDPVSLTLDIRDTELVLKRIHGEKVLVDLNYEGKTDKVFVRNIQRDPVKSKLIHVDFFRVDLNKEIETRIPVVGIGQPKGLKVGGILEHGVRDIAIRALPTAVPPHLEVDLSDLDINHSIHVSDIAAIDGVKFLSASETVLFACVSKQKEEEEAPAVAAEATSAAT